MFVDRLSVIMLMRISGSFIWDGKCGRQPRGRIDWWTRAEPSVSEGGGAVRFPYLMERSREVGE